MHETPEGFLVCLNVPIARTGEMVYARGELPGIEADGDGKIIVSRDALEVFRPETIKSFEGKSLTLWHPQEMVEPKNWSAVTKGTIQNVRRGSGAFENDLLCDILVNDDRAIELIKGGLRQVSCGYEADYIQTGAGRAIQKNIIGNHLAMVDEGRAGSAYAIMDQKGKGRPMTLTEKIKALLTKNQDEALKLVAEVETIDRAADKKAPSLEEVMSTLKSVGEQLDVITKKTKDYLSMPSQVAPAVADVEGAPASLEDRLKKLEDMVAKMLEAQSVGDEDKEDKEKEESKDEEKKDDDKEESKDEEKKDDDKEESKDEAEEEGEEVEDDKCEDDGEYEMTGDEKSRIEILAPGAKLSGKDAKVKALKAAYQTKDGKSVIDRFTGGKSPDLKNEKFVEAIFIGASEILKETRTSDLARTKTRDTQEIREALAPKGAMSADALNKKMEAHYYGKK